MARNPMSVEEVIDQVQERIKRNRMSEAVRQNFLGGLSVDPSKVYVSSEELEDALRQLRKYAGGSDG